ncbi:MAG: hypothetical protein JWO18_653 [Microbacteriaceae bacterium]|nr:hypothetical protein [Microbacteriaceae bacterium]
MVGMDHLVIDTNYLYRDPVLESAAWNNLVTLQRDGRAKLYLPLVALREHMRHEEQPRHQAINSAIAGYREAHTSLSDLGLTLPPLDVGSLRHQRDEIAETREFEAEFRARLDESNVTLLPYPAVDGEHLADAYFIPRKPFNANGEGTADYLIWRSFVELLHSVDPADRVVLISSNTNDFTHDGALHPDLVRGLEASRVAWHKDPREYVTALETPVARPTTLVAGRSLEVTQGETELAVDAAWTYVSGQMLYHEITSGYGWNEFEIQGYDAPPYFENPEFESIDLDEKSANWDPYDELDAGAGVLGRLTVRAHVGIGAYMFKSDLAVYEGVDVVDFDHNDHMAAVADELEATIEFHVRIEGEHAEVLNVESITAEPAAG